MTRTRLCVLLAACVLGAPLTFLSGGALGQSTTSDEPIPVAGDRC